MVRRTLTCLDLRADLGPLFAALIERRQASGTADAASGRSAQPGAVGFAAGGPDGPPNPHVSPKRTHLATWIGNFFAVCSWLLGLGATGRGWRLRREPCRTQAREEIRTNLRFPIGQKGLLVAGQGKLGLEFQ